MMRRMLSPIEPRCTGICGALAISAPSASKIAQEKSSRSLMLTLVAVDCSATPISSAIAMNRLLKISSRTGSTSVPIALARSSGTARVSTSVPSLRPLGAPARLDDDRRSRIEDERGPSSPKEDSPSGGGVSTRFERPQLLRPSLCGPSDRFHDQRIDDDLRVLVPIAEALLVKRRRSSACICSGDAMRNFQRRVAARRPQPRAAQQLDPFAVEALLDQRIARAPLQAREARRRNPHRAA